MDHVRKNGRADTRLILRTALLNSGHLSKPSQADPEDSKVAHFDGWSAVMRVLAAVHDICSNENRLPALDAFLLDRASISHRKKEIRRPVCHLLIASKPEAIHQYEAQVMRMTANVLTKERGVMIRVHATEAFLYEQRHRLSSLFPVYLAIDIKGLCPSVLKPSALRRTLSRLRHPIKGYGEYPQGPGW